MTPVTDEQLALLADYIAGAKPDDRHEVEMYCPHHPDRRRSASLNVRKGAWYCHAGCGGSSVEQLINSRDTWVEPPVTRRDARVAEAPRSRPEFRPTLQHVRLWRNALMADEDRLAWLEEERGILEVTAHRASLGWHERRNVYTIPVFNSESELSGLRYYDPDPGPDRRKIWSIKGMGKPQLYPVRTLRSTRPGDAILFCEGEWDTLLAIQSGVLAVTRTGAAKVWRDTWGLFFEERRVYLCHDRDLAGVAGNEVVAEGLAEVAQEVLVCELPYPVTEKDGKDLSDYILEYGPEAIWSLMDNAKEVQPWTHK